MVLLFNLFLLVLMLRLSFEKKLLKPLFYKKWPDVINIQHIIFWLAFSSANLYLYLEWFDWKEGIFRWLFMLIVNITLYLFCFQKLVPEYYENKKYEAYIRYTSVVYILSCLIRILIEPALFAGLHHKENAFLILVYVSQLMIVLIASMLGISKYKLIVERELVKMEALKKEAELDLMKSKINPHFLFNTLNNIYSHSYKQDSSAANLIKQLSLLLQYTTYDVAKKRIVLEKEIEMILALSSLYQLKYAQGLNLVFDYTYDEYFGIIEIPPTIYFTLFENAIKHSALGVDEHAFITIKLSLQNEELCFHIRNSKSSRSYERSDQNYKGIGLKVLKTIMESEYPENHQFMVEESETTYSTILTIKI
ncbi:sensor histidine kinase [Pedobacter sp. MC2016-24]|uniref:sensor histidine kinase n=1 Tax=Pedobacter sp. MC2016-24 TaxID=2780090 RepID=UPI00187FD08E|nr:histidine kinase [Pedobacter sp. MC2016-24]MBE9598526.1 histidine kinase [Pedobacter sp. MC2016-24]